MSHTSASEYVYTLTLFISLTLTLSFPCFEFITDNRTNDLAESEPKL